MAAKWIVIGRITAIEHPLWSSFVWRNEVSDTFVETVAAMHPYYVIRMLGGLLYLTGALMMAWNMFKTITSDELRIPAPASVPAGAVAAE